MVLHIIIITGGSHDSGLSKALMESPSHSVQKLLCCDCCILCWVDQINKHLLLLLLHLLAVNKFNRGESVRTKQNNSSKCLVIVVIINQNKVHVCPTIIIMLSLCSRYPQLEDGRR